MITRPAFLSLMAIVILGAQAHTLAGEQPVIQLGHVPLLFVDDSGVESRAGIARTVHTARTLAEPVLQPERRWEGERVYIYGSIYPDPAAGGLRMWYMGVEKLGSGIRTLYATSQDSIHWLKPSLGLTEFSGARDNNILLDLNSPSVVLDSFEQDPAKRYKLIGILGKRDYAAYFSADGLHWTPYPNNPVFSGGDTLTVTQDSRNGEFLLFHKREARVRGFERRSVFVARSRDFQSWSSPAKALVPDEEDDAWATGDQEHTQIYSMSVYSHASGFIGMPMMFRVLSHGKRGPGKSGMDGPIDVQLVTSPDGQTWRHTWPRLNVIPRGAPGTFDGGAILGVSSTLVQFGDESCVYYTALTTGHGGSVGIKRLTIGRAAWRRDGFISLDADPMGGSVQTKPLRLTGPSLLVNADASRGKIRVALLEADGKPVAGFGLAESDVLHTDAIRWTAQWKNETKVPTDRPVRVVVEMTSARLFSLASGTDKTADAAGK